jgi:hypothetical protein
VKRGVSEVISTIMLNAIATYLVAWLLQGRVKVRGQQRDQHQVHPRVLARARHTADGIGEQQREIYGLIFLAILVGFLYWFILGKTRFGFDLRATGRSETAAVASGVKVKRMVLMSMVALRCRRGPGRYAVAVRPGPRLRHDLPGRARASPASPSRCSGATTPRHRVRGAVWGYLEQQSNGLQINGPGCPTGSSTSSRASSSCPSSSPTSWCAGQIIRSSNARSPPSWRPSEPSPERSRGGARHEHRV